MNEVAAGSEGVRSLRSVLPALRDGSGDRGAAMSGGCFSKSARISAAIRCVGGAMRGR